MILFVHGVPDTALLWDPLVRALGLKPDSYRALSLPGFGNPVPAGFSSTKDAYAGWLVEQMEAAGEPVHIVGHDWGRFWFSARPQYGRTSFPAGV